MKLKLGDLYINIEYVMVIKVYKISWLMIKINIWLLENARKCSKTARNICCLAWKLLEIFIAWLGLARIFLENELLENAWLEFYFPCLKSHIARGFLDLDFEVDASILPRIAWKSPVYRKMLRSISVFVYKNIFIKSA